MSEVGFSREPMLEVYLFEATQLMEQLEGISIECEKSKKISTEAINEIFRIMHTVKSSSAMMMFNNISVLAHSMEDLFYFIRENKAVIIDFESLFDLVLSGIDFIKGEVSKIENDGEADGFSEALVLKSSILLQNMKEANGPVIKDNSVQQNDDTKYYISSYQNSSKEIKQKYTARIFYEDGCEMENVRAYTVIHNLKDMVSEMYHIPEDIIESNDSVEVIRKSGFLIGFSTSVEKEKVEEALNEIIFLRELELLQVDEYPQELKALKEKRVIILEEQMEQVETNKEEVENVTKSGKQQSIISVNISKLDMLLDILKELYKGYSNSINKTIKIAEDSISIDLKSDITILKRVLGNMIKNALEATVDNGVVTIGCNKETSYYVKFWVRNSIYISEEVQNSVFKRAFSTKGKERGLGTYSMKLLGEKYLKGFVGFTSSEDEGTCFYIKIPK